MGKVRTPPHDILCVKTKPRKGSTHRQSTPSSLQNLLESFSGCFSHATFENFAALVTGWILCQGRHCVSRVIQVSGDVASRKHFSTLFRFFARAKWSTDEVGRVIFRLLLKWSPKQIEVLVDDTLCRHSGPRMFGAAMHRDPLASSYGRGSSSGATTFFSCGHSWVVLAMRIPLPWDAERGIAVPFLFRLYRSKKRCPEERYRKRTELARDLIEMLESWIPSEFQLLIAGDREYASKTVVKKLKVATTFVGSAAMNAMLHAEPGEYSGCGRPRVRGKRLQSPRDMASDDATPWTLVVPRIYGRKVKLLIKERVCLWPTVAGKRLVRVVVTRDPKGVLEDLVFFSTNPELSAACLLEVFARRWLIEVCFRDAKQHLGLQDPQNGWSKGKRSERTKKKPGPQARGERGALAILRTVPIGFTAQAIVILWYLEHGNCAREVRRARKHSPWYRQKARPSFRDMLVAIRRECWATRLFGYPGKRAGREVIGWLLPDAMMAA